MMSMKKLSKNAMIGYPAGIITGIAYGLNPLFGMPLIKKGVAIESILFFRYSIAVLLLGTLFLFTKQSLKISWRQGGVLLLLGLLFTISSITLFESYLFIPSGLATTLVFLYPVLVALIMVFLGVVPSWPVWLSIIATFIGVIIMTYSSPSQNIDLWGILLAVGSALSYAFFIIIINKNQTISTLSNTILTFYSLLVGSVVFFIKANLSGTMIMSGISTNWDWLNIVALAIFPTIISTASLALSTRNIGATKASVLGVFEPITAIVVGTLFLGEILTANIVIGILISIVAVTFMIVMTKR